MSSGINSELSKIRGVVISARENSEYELIRSQIFECDKTISCYHLDQIIETPKLLESVDFILTIGGDGSIAWLVAAYYKAFDGIEGIKPIIPVVRPESVGYLKQLDFEREKFKEGFKKLLRGEYEIIQRTVLALTVDNQKSIAVNEVSFSSNPHLGKFTVSIENGEGTREIIAEIFADGAMLATSIGSTAWALSHGGLLNISEESVELIFIGAMHKGANFVLPKKGKIGIQLELKNPVITKETVFAYNQARKLRNLPIDPQAKDTLTVVYSSQVLADGKVLTFGSKSITIDPNCSIPFVIIKDHSVYEKARKYTRNTEALW
jgi:NAD kinase